VNAWRFEIERAVKRSMSMDFGARAAAEGILGLPLSVQGTKAERVYERASTARRVRNHQLQAKNQRMLNVGTTGHPDLDKALRKNLETFIGVHT
jgi:hypothetical protein